MYNTHEEIEKLEQLINKYSQRRDKIENGNYILAMQLKAIKEGKLLTVEDVAKWDFEMMRVGDSIRSIDRSIEGSIEGGMRGDT